MMRRIAKPLVAVASVLALLFVSAQPSSAATTGTVNSGTLSVNLTPALVEDLTPPGVCPAGISLTASTSDATNPHTVTLTLVVDDAAFDYNGSRYFLDNITATATGASFDTALDTIATGSFTSTTGNIYTANAAPNDCTRTNTTLCAGVRLATTAPILNLNGTFGGTVGGSPTEVLGTGEVDGSGKIQAVGCNAPFAALNSSVLTLTDLNVTFA